MNCKHCGAILNEGDTFCNQCGNKVENDNTQTNQPYQATIATEWHESSAQSQAEQQYQATQTDQQYQMNQQYQASQTSQQHQPYQQPYQNQQKSKDGKTILAIVLCILIVPAILFVILIFSLGFFIFNSASDTVQNVSNSMTEAYEVYNRFNDSEQSIDNPPSILYGTGKRVKLDGYTFEIPSTINAETNDRNTRLVLNKKDGTWTGELRTIIASFDKLKKNQAMLGPSIEAAIEEEGGTIGEFRLETIGGKEYILADLTSSFGKGLIGYTKLNSTTTVTIVLTKVTGSSTTEPLKEINTILDSAI